MSTLVLSACGGKNKPDGDTTSGGDNTQDTSGGELGPITPKEASDALVSAASKVNSYRGSYSMVQTDTFDSGTPSVTITKKGYKNPSGEYYKIVDDKYGTQNEKIIINTHDSSYAVLYEDSLDPDGVVDDTEFHKVAYHYGEDTYNIKDFEATPYEKLLEISNHKDLLGKFYAVLYAYEMGAGDLDYDNPGINYKYARAEGNKISHQYSMNVDLKLAGQADKYPYYYMETGYEYIYDSDHIYSYKTTMTMVMHLNASNSTTMSSVKESVISYEFDQELYNSITLQSAMPAIDTMDYYDSGLYVKYKGVNLYRYDAEPGKPIAFADLKTAIETRYPEITLNHLYFDEARTQEFTTLSSVSSNYIELYPDLSIKDGYCEFAYHFHEKEIGAEFVGKFTEEELATIVGIVGSDPTCDERDYYKVEFPAKDSNFRIQTSYHYTYYPTRKVDGVASTSFTFDTTGAETYHTVELSAEHVGDVAGAEEENAIDIIENAHAFEPENFLKYDINSMDEHISIYLKFDITQFTGWGGTIGLVQYNDAYESFDSFSYGLSNDYTISVFYYISGTKNNVEFDGTDVESQSAIRAAGATDVYVKVTSRDHPLRGIVTLYMY